MGLIISGKSAVQTEPIPAGTYPARCVGVVDLGTQQGKFDDRPKSKVAVIFEVPSVRIEVDGESKPRWCTKMYAASLNEKATLYADLCAWRGRPFTPEERENFNLANIVGKPCVVCIKNTEKNGAVYANISSVGAAMKGLDMPPLENEPIVFDMEAPNAEEAFQKVPGWIQKIIRESSEWKKKSPSAAVSASSGVIAQTPTDEEMDEFEEILGSSDGNCPF